MPSLTRIHTIRKIPICFIPKLSALPKPPNNLTPPLTLDAENTVNGILCRSSLFITR